MLGGAGVDIIPQHLRIEANGGYFDRGTNPLFFGTTVGAEGRPSPTTRWPPYGGTLQVSAFSGISPTQSADFKLYLNDPMVTASRYFTRPVYLPGFNWLASAEFTGVGTTLQDVGRPNSTEDAARLRRRRQPARAVRPRAPAQADFETRSLELHPAQPAVAGAVPGLPGGLADRLRALRRRSASTTLRADRHDGGLSVGMRAAGDVHAAGGAAV